jgi:RNA polymerase sigma-70 factor (ECF subfamily)
VFISADEFVTGLRNNDELVFEKVFKDYYEVLCNYANNMICNIDDAEEIVQNMYLTIWEKRENVNIHTSIKSYLYKAVYNSCLNWMKHNRIRQKHGEATRHQTELYIDDSSEHLLGKELEEQIGLAINSIPKKCRTVFKLSRFENLTYSEIADQLNLSVKTVDNHMVKALRILRERLKDYLPLLLWLVLKLILQY